MLKLKLDFENLEKIDDQNHPTKGIRKSRIELSKRIQVSDYVEVSLKDPKRGTTKKFYGMIIETTPLEVKFMKDIANKNIKVWPQVDDISIVEQTQICSDIYTTGKSRRRVLQLKSPEKEGPTFTVKMWGEKAQMPVPVREKSIQLKNIEVVNYKGQMEGNST
ncbi:unnamed protein product [Mytilus edulis]|uniref:Uncharacterized protein n=1 Tax=Mytilus edulis TaxID=6550 RepID=A0A8S3S9C8_MYTED|nr:unnamed protein product [Mytilus edulis]